MKKKYVLIGCNSAMAIDFARYLSVFSHHTIGFSSEGDNRNPFIRKFLGKIESYKLEELMMTFDGAIVVYFAWRSPRRNPSGLEVYRKGKSLEDLRHYIETIRLSNFTKFVFISSAGAIYGASNNINFEHSDIMPITEYGKEKKEAELEIKKSIPLHSLLICRVTNPFGFYIMPRNGIGFVDHALNNAMLRGQIDIFGTGEIERD